MYNKEEESNTVSNDILFIESVNLENLNDKKIIDYDDENTYDLKNCLNDTPLNKYELQYDKLREHFYSLDTWHSTNILCFYCHNSFINKPVFIIKKIISPNQFQSWGNFCSFSCCAKYIHIYYKDDDIVKSNYINNLKYLYKIFYGKDITLIRESPDYTLQTRYGGTLTTEEYKDKIKKIKHIF
jgi:hypothetical protein